MQLLQLRRREEHFHFTQTPFLETDANLTPSLFNVNNIDSSSETKTVWITRLNVFILFLSSENSVCPDVLVLNVVAS